LSDNNDITEKAIEEMYAVRQTMKTPGWKIIKERLQKEFLLQTERSLSSKSLEAREKARLDALAARKAMNVPKNIINEGKFVEEKMRELRGE